MKIIYEAVIKDEDNDNEVICKVSSYTKEGLEEEMGKSKWTDAIAKYEEIQAEIVEDQQRKWGEPNEADNENENGLDIERGEVDFGIKEDDLLK